MLIPLDEGIDAVPQSLDEFMDYVVAKSAAQFEFHQAVREVIQSVWPLFERHPEYLEQKIPDRMVHAERIIIFRVPWIDDSGTVQVNRGYRVEMSSAIGPYKGGLRFHPSVRSRHSEVPCVRAGVQERLDNAPHGWR